MYKLIGVIVGFILARYIFLSDLEAEQWKWFIFSWTEGKDKFGEIKIVNTISPLVIIKIIIGCVGGYFLGIYAKKSMDKKSTPPRENNE